MNMSQHTCVGGDVLHPSDQHPLKDGDWVLFGKTFDRQVYEIVVSYCLMQRLLFNNFYLTIFIQTLSSCSPFSPSRYSTIKTVTHPSLPADGTQQRDAGAEAAVRDAVTELCSRHDRAAAARAATRGAEGYVEAAAH